MSASWRSRVRFEVSDHRRRTARAHRSELRDRHARLGQELEQERLEVVVGAIELVDQQHRRQRAGVPMACSSGRRHQELLAEQLGLVEIGPGRLRRPDPAAADGGSSTRRAPPPRRCPRSTAAGSASCRAPPRAPWRPRSCRPRPRPRAAAAGAGAARGRSPSPGPGRPGSRPRRGRRSSVSMSGTAALTAGAAPGCAGVLTARPGRREHRLVVRPRVDVGRDRARHGDLDHLVAEPVDQLPDRLVAVQLARARRTSRGRRRAGARGRRRSGRPRAACLAAAGEQRARPCRR